MRYLPLADELHQTDLFLACPVLLQFFLSPIHYLFNYDALARHFVFVEAHHAEVTPAQVLDYRVLCELVFLREALSVQDLSIPETCVAFLLEEDGVDDAISAQEADASQAQTHAVDGDSLRVMTVQPDLHTVEHV